MFGYVQENRLMAYEWRVRPRTKPGTLVTISPAGPDMDVHYWNEEMRGGGRTKDPGPYVLIKAYPPLASRNVWRPVKCINHKGEVFIFSHFDLVKV
jgi:hypothetical protein